MSDDKVINQDRMALARINAAKENADVKPADLLRAFIAEIAAGKDVTQMVIIYRVGDRTDAKTFNQGTWRCGVTRDDELAMMELSKFALLNRMHNGGT